MVRSRVWWGAAYGEERRNSSANIAEERRARERMHYHGCVHG
jgi:hypothetical protein